MPLNLNFDSPVSIAQVLCKLLGVLDKITSIHVELFGFLQRVGYLKRLVRLQLSQKAFRWCSAIPTLKSPKIKMFSYVVECRSRYVLNASRWLQIIVLFGLYEQLLTIFHYADLVQHKTSRCDFFRVKQVISNMFSNVQHDATTVAVAI